MNWTKALAMAVIVLFASRSYGQMYPGATTDKPLSAKPVFALAVDPPPPPIHINGSVDVTITVTNITDNKIFWESDRGKDSVYKAFVIVLTRDGHELETTVFNRKITGRQRSDDPLDVEAGSSISLPYPPGKMFVMTIDLKRLYDIKEPGPYTLEVSRFDLYSKTTVRSKTNLNIVP